MIEPRPIAIRAAVVCFFGLGIVGTVTGLAPSVCCERAVIGSAAAYVVAGIAVRAVNLVLVQAMISDRGQKDKERSRDGRD